MRTYAVYCRSVVGNKASFGLRRAWVMSSSSCKRNMIRYGRRLLFCVRGAGLPYTISRPFLSVTVKVTAITLRPLVGTLGLFRRMFYFYECMVLVNCSPPPFFLSYF